MPSSDASFPSNRACTDARAGRSAWFHSGGGGDVAEAVAGDPGGGEAFGDYRCRVVEKDGHAMIVAEVARRGEGAEVDGVEVSQAAQVDDQAQRA